MRDKISETYFGQEQIAQGIYTHTQRTEQAQHVHPQKRKQLHTTKK